MIYLFSIRNRGIIPKFHSINRQHIAIILLLLLLPLPFYGYYPQQPLLASSPSKELKESFTARMPLLTTTSTFGLELD